MPRRNNRMYMYVHLGSKVPHSLTAAHSAIESGTLRRTASRSHQAVHRGRGALVLSPGALPAPPTACAYSPTTCWCTDTDSAAAQCCSTIGPVAPVLANMPRGSPKQRGAVPTPASRLGEWSEAEKEKLRELHAELGPEGNTAWNQLATQLPGRSGRAAAKQWDKMIKRQPPRRRQTLGWDAVRQPASGRKGLVHKKNGDRFAGQKKPRTKRSYAEVAP